MSSHAPDQFPAFLLKPCMTFELAVKVVDLKAGVVRLISTFDAVSSRDEEALNDIID